MMLAILLDAILWKRSVETEILRSLWGWFGRDIYTTFTCQATVRINETARSDVIVRFGLHVCKSFAGWWTKGCMELESMYADVQISRIRQLLSMPFKSLVLSLMDHAAHCKIHPLQTCTDVCSMSWSLSHVQSYRQTKFNTGFISAMLKNSLEITALLHVSANA